jgi:DNA-binding CsgD family transcriptional regulator
LAWVLGLSGDLPGQIAVESEVVEAALLSGDESLAVEALCGLGTAKAVAGNFVEGQAILERSAAMAASLGRSYREAWAKAIVAWSLIWTGRLDEAEAALTDAASLNASDLPPVNAVIAWYAGDFRACVESVLELNRWNPGGLGPRRAWATSIAAMAASEMGRHDDARSYLKQADVVYRGRGWFSHTRRNQWAAGVVAFLGGERESGIRSMQEAFAAFWSMGVRCEIDVVLTDIAEASAQIGDAATSGWAATELAGLPTVDQSPLVQALAELGEAWAYYAERRFDDSLAAANEALKFLRESRYRVFAARALDVRGRSALAIDRATGVESLKDAAALYAQCQANVRRTAVLTLLKDAGSAGKRAMLAGLGERGLTSRERQVARLVIEGNTSREVAAVLGIGKRTVDTHVDHVLAKTGLKSRLELARKGSRLGIVD